MIIIAIVIDIILILLSLKYVWRYPNANLNKTRIMMNDMIAERLPDEKKSGLRVSPEMLDSGVFELGGLTISHPYLPNTSIDIKKHEILECKNILETTFNTKVSSFAYPFGIYNDEDIDIIETSNFESAVTTDEGVVNSDTPFELKRIKASGKDNFFAFKLRVLKGFRGFI